MQTFTAKEVKPAIADNKPTIIITEDGSKLSGFDASLKTMKPGTVFEAEIKLEKGYTNIKSYKVIQAGTSNALPSSNGYGQDSPEKRASIETMNAITNVITAITNWRDRRIHQRSCWTYGTERWPGATPEYPIK